MSRSTSPIDPAFKTIVARYMSPSSDASTVPSLARYPFSSDPSTSPSLSRWNTMGDMASDCSLTPRGSSKGGAATPTTAPDGACGQAVQVKNTFLHVVFPEDVEQPAMRRSTSAPALLTATADGTAPQVAAELEVQMQEANAWASWEEGVAARAKADQLHRQGSCRPCLYFAFKADSCRNSDECEFCHLCTREDVMRRRKQHRMRTRMAIKDPTGKETGARHWASRRSARLTTTPAQAYCARGRAGAVPGMGHGHPTRSPSGLPSGSHGPFQSARPAAMRR